MGRWVGNFYIDSVDYGDDIIIPRKFLDVIYGLRPEIHSIKNIRSEKLDVWDEEYKTNYIRFTVHFDIILNPGSDGGSEEYYTDLINDYFVMTYTDIDFIQFMVNKVEVYEDDPKEIEIFRSLFLKTP